jgi:hypothetical protein
LVPCDEVVNSTAVVLSAGKQCAPFQLPICCSIGKENRGNMALTCFDCVLAWQASMLQELYVSIANGSQWKPTTWDVVQIGALSKNVYSVKQVSHWYRGISSIALSPFFFY